MNSDKPITLVSAEESAKVARSVRAWLNKCPDRPIGKLEFEFLGENDGICLSTVQTAYKTKQYIDGTYQAQYQFKIVYRTITVNADERLNADEMLDRFAEWAENNIQQLKIADNIRVIRIKRDTASALFARYEKGVEDHETQLTLLYEVV